MSHSAGQVLDVLGDIVGHFEYNGTVDVAKPQIFVTAEALNDAWRCDQAAPCACTGTVVTLSCDKLTWDARACFVHGFIVHGLSPLYYQEEEF